MKSKTFHPADHDLWDEVRRNISPLKKPARPSAKLQTQPAPTNNPPRPANQPVQMRTKTGVADGPPQLSAFDRRTAQRLSRGQLEPESSLDLHGEGIAVARVKLLRFLETQRHQDRRLVLVITGKGGSPFGRHTLHGVAFYHAPEREGRLRQEVPYWLHDAPFREHVSGFQPAHPRHGGGGAFYVRLRRPKPQP